MSINSIGSWDEGGPVRPLERFSARLIEVVDPAARARFPSDPEVVRLLIALWAKARAAWPEVAIPTEAFVEHLTQVADRPGAALARVRAVEVYLALACVRGDAQAQAAFDREYMPALEAALAEVVDQPERVQRLKRLLRARLLRGVGGRPPEIGRYGGLARLDAWLKLVATRFARRFLRAEARQRAGAPGADQALEDRVTEPGVETLPIESRAELVEALRRAVETLGERERHLLTLHLVNGISVADIARSQGMRRSAALRWLEGIQCRLYQRTRALLSNAAVGEKEDEAEAQELERLLQSCFFEALERELKTALRPSGSRG